MGNLTLPTPVALAAATLCVLGGFVAGAAAARGPADRSTAEVHSYQPATEALCLTGEAVADEPAAEDGVLCGTWRHPSSAPRPILGEEFRFAVMVHAPEGVDVAAVFLYGEPVR